MCKISSIPNDLILFGLVLTLGTDKFRAQGCGMVLAAVCGVSKFFRPYSQVGEACGSIWLA